ncbi:putative oxoglutarate/iron-dependent dioxygenase, isopenicillin N synthase [Helianthus anomalus]
MCVLQETHYFMVTLSVYDDMGNNRSVGKRLTSLIAMALNLEDAVFEKVKWEILMRLYMVLLHILIMEWSLFWQQMLFLASRQFNISFVNQCKLCLLFGFLIYDMFFFLGLQVCREEHKQPRIWEDVRHIKGAFIINLGDLMERWTNCLFRSTLHRIMPTGKERYSMALFLDPNPDRIVECLKSCCSDSSPPRFPPIRSGDHLRERISAAYSSSS